MSDTATRPRLIRMQAENFKRLRAVQIEFDGGVTRITGQNGQGKTSVLDAIQAAIGGKDMVPAAPLRKGEKRGSVSVRIENVMVDGVLMDLVVTRQFHEGKDSSLTIVSPEGVKVRSPQAVLDGLMAKIGFDPLAFTRQKPKEQAETLRKLAGLDFTKPDQMRAKFYQERTSVNRDLDRARARLATAPHHEDVPEAEVSAADAVAQVDELRKARQAWQEARSRVESARSEVAAIEQKLAEAREELICAESALDGAVEVTAEQVAAASDSLKGIESVNRRVRENLERKTLDVEIGRLEQESESLSDKIRRIDEGKAERIAAAKLPVEGLGFDEDGVMFNGVPFSEASAAEQLRVSTAVAIALNPSLRLMLIRDGSLLDSDSMAILENMAEEHDAQVIVEQVTDGEPVGIRIVDGMVADE